MLSICGASKDSWESVGLRGDQTSQSWRKSSLNPHWKDWCWSWSSNTVAIWYKELTHRLRQLDGISTWTGRSLSKSQRMAKDRKVCGPCQSRRDWATDRLVSSQAVSLPILMTFSSPFYLASVGFMAAPPSSSNCSNLHFELRESRSWRLESCLQELGGQRGLSAWEPPRAPFRFISTH